MNSTSSYLIYIRKFHGNAAVLLLRSLLGPVFLARSLSHYFAYILNVDVNGKEKSDSYFSAAMKLFVRERL